MSSMSDVAQPGVDGDLSPSDQEAGAEGAGSQIQLKPLAAIGILAAAVGAAGLVGYKLGEQPEQKPLVLSTSAHDQALAYEVTESAPESDQVVLSEYQARLGAMLLEQQRLRVELERIREEASRKGHHALGSVEALADAHRELRDVRMELAAAQSAREGLNQTLGTLAGTMEQVISERDDAAAKAESLDERIAEIASVQDEKLKALEDAARISLDGMQGIFERTGLDLNEILEETREDYTGEGGPFEVLPDEQSSALEPTSVRVAALMGDLEEVNLMRYAAQRLPFGEPVTNARMTSHFGPRHDPMGRGRALHKGIDYAGPKGTPILATADGVVTFAGAQRGYGRIVTIQHAFGVETRFAHLNRFHVKVGQRVKRGDHIADMGNTGRSTGTHLHYEIRIDREAVNPANFVEASHDVL